MTRNNTRRTIKSKSTTPNKPQRPPKERRPLRPSRATARLMMPQDETLLFSAYGAEPHLLRRRLDLALWFVLYEEALSQVAFHERGRYRALMAIGDRAKAVLANWPEIAADCARKIRVETSFPWHFELVLDGTFDDETLRVRYQLRPRVGIGQAYIGWEEPPFPSKVLECPIDPLRAHEIGSGRIDAAIRNLARCQGRIPTADDLDRAEERARDTSPKVVYRRSVG